MIGIRKRTANGAVASKRALESTLLAAFFVLAGALVGVQLGAQDEATAAPAPITASECGDCHDEAAEFAAGPHGRAMKRLSEETFESSCEACHGSGSEHIEDPLPENIVRFPDDGACATCHDERAGLLWLARRGHRSNGVACLECHAPGHDDAGVEHMLVAEPLETCGGCHQQQAAAARRPFAHRDGVEPFACTECHSAHNLERTARLALEDEAGVCTECHTEQRGPFVFPHPGRAVNGCLECHEPHGSTNPRLLTRRSVFTQCLECHTDVPSFHDLTQERYRTCLSCHPAVHGSNRGSRLFEP